MSDVPRGQEEQATEFAQQLFGENQLAETTDSERVPSIVENGVRDGTLATAVGALLLWRAVRSVRHGYLRAAAQAALGIVISYIGVRQHRLDAAGSSSTEGVADDVAKDERNRLNGKKRSAAEAGDPDHRRTPDEESEPIASSRNRDKRELGGGIPGEMSDPAFTADAETQGRSQPSLNADVHDPRRGAGNEELNLSETALTDDSTEAASSGTERDRPIRTDESGDVLGSEGSQPDDEYEVSADERSGPTENGVSGEGHSKDSDSKADVSDEDEEGGNGDVPDPDVSKARDDGDDGADAAGLDTDRIDENESNRDE